ncbi:uncharacterized protein HKW66_Vig0020840 [Vigna angularis]|uniref:Mono-/di-acylglycerol lipase N-terminal domain-containing protein n=1 Tax=Phaseolus angularis TaxID=3914 RepID=A0A8T0L6Q4_PHAAN|nr:uncharacterized protein HKW66_Vig0020840 [Vigna angularis]
MTAGAMATAAGAAVTLYLLLRRRKKAEEEWSRARTLRVRPAQAPANLFESIVTLSETLRFTYSETIGKWPIADLAFGINSFMRKKGDLTVADVYGGSGCVELKGPDVVADLEELLRLLTLCMLFSKKPFPEFLDSAGFSQDHVLLHSPKAEVEAVLAVEFIGQLLKPAFTIIHDMQSRCFLLLIRGTHSIKDTLTAATGAMVPFHHSIVSDGQISNLVLGHAHCGMVAAARWIAKLCTPALLKALNDCPDSKVKVVIKHAQSVAKAVVKTMTAHSPNIGPLSKSKLNNLVKISLEPEPENISTSLLTKSVSVLNKDEPNSSSGKSELDVADEEELVIDTNEHITEGELWHELEKELEKQNILNILTQVEEADTENEIIEEDQLVNANNSISTSGLVLARPVVSIRSLTSRLSPPDRTG